MNNLLKEIIKEMLYLKNILALIKINNKFYNVGAC